MNTKPNIGNFLEVNSKSFSFKDRPDGLVYKDKESGQLYSEVNAFSNRLKIEIPYTLFAAIMYILSLVQPQWEIWEYGIYIMIICVIPVFMLVFTILRYFFTKFEPIEKEEEAAGTGYKSIEFALIFIPSIMLFLI